MNWKYEEQERRARVAFELDKREFWKANFIASKQNGFKNQTAQTEADAALEIYLSKFGDRPFK